MKVLLKTTKVFVALICLANFVHAAQGDLQRNDLHDAMNGLAQGFLGDNSLTKESMDRIQKVSESLLESDQSIVEKALSVVRSEATNEDKLNALEKISKHRGVTFNHNPTVVEIPGVEGTSSFASHKRFIAIQKAAFASGYRPGNLKSAPSTSGRTELNDLLNDTLLDFLQESPMNLTYALHIETLTKGLLDPKSPQNQSTIEEALGIMKSEEMGKEAKIDALLEICNNPKALPQPRAFRGAAASSASSSSSRANTLLQNLRELVNDTQREDLEVAEMLLASIPKSIARDILEDMSRSELTQDNVDQIIAALIQLLS